MLQPGGAAEARAAGHNQRQALQVRSTLGPFLTHHTTMRRHTSRRANGAAPLRSGHFQPAGKRVHTLCHEIAACAGMKI